MKAKTTATISGQARNILNALIVILSVLTFSIWLQSCSKNLEMEPELEVRKSEGLAPQTIVMINEPLESTLVSITADGLTYSITGRQISKIKVGSILIGFISSLAPNGYLRKVLEVKTVNDTKVLKTDQIALNQGILNGEGYFKSSFGPSDVIFADSGNNLGSLKNKGPSSEHNVIMTDRSLISAAGSDRILFSIPPTIFDADDNLKTTNDQIEVKGTIVFEPSVDFNLSLKNAKVSNFTSVITLKNTNTLQAATNTSILGVHRQWEIGRINLKPFTTLIAGAPIVVAQRIVFILGVEANVLGKATIGAQNINTIKAGFVYEDATFRTISEVSNNLTMQEFEWLGSGSVMPSIQMRYEFIPYGYEGGSFHVAAKASAEAKASITANGTSSTTNWGVKFDGLAELKVFDWSIFRYEKTFYEKSFPFFSAIKSKEAIVSTSSVENISQTSATCGGVITSNGGATITSKGVCWSTSALPTTANNKTSDGSGDGNYSSNLVGLSAGTTYYARAYAINAAGTSYGSVMSFKTKIPSQTLTVASLTTSGIQNVTATTANCGGEIVANGGATITAKGVCWSTSSSPTTANDKTSNGSGDGDFISNLTGLSANTVYYVRSYAVNSVGTAYGPIVSFKTKLPSQSLTVPSLTTSEIQNITAISAIGGGEIVANGGTAISAKGVCWSTTSSPTIANNKISNGSGETDFVSNITGLAPGTIYYVRSYATNSAGTGYGTAVSFKTKSADPVTTIPQIKTTVIEDIAQNSAIGGGDIIGNGGSQITSKGLCWSTSGLPTTSNTKTVNGSGDGDFKGTLSSLSANTTYYVRAYAINIIGTGYGEVLSFKTLATIASTKIISLAGDFSFGEIKVGQSANRTLAISNNGNSILNVSSISFSEGFTGSFAGQVLPGKTVNVNVKFSPTKGQNYYGSLSVNCDATAGSKSIVLQGKGITSTGTGSSPVATPVVNSYSNCVTARTNPTCSIYTDGTITARVTNIDTKNNSITFEIKKCNGSSFNSAGKYNIVSGLCSGESYKFGSFQSGVNSFQVTITDNDMRGTKYYYPFIVQGSATIFQYDAPAITIKY